MTARKPSDPRDDVQISDVLRDRFDGDASRGTAEESISPDPKEMWNSEDAPDEVGLHTNVEVESGPVDREDGEDPLPQAP